MPRDSNSNLTSLPPDRFRDPFIRSLSSPRFLSTTIRVFSASPISNLSDLVDTVFFTYGQILNLLCTITKFISSTLLSELVNINRKTQSMMSTGNNSAGKDRLKKPTIQNNPSSSSSTTLASEIQLNTEFIPSLFFTEPALTHILSFCHQANSYNKTRSYILNAGLPNKIVSTMVFHLQTSSDLRHHSLWMSNPVPTLSPFSFGIYPKPIIPYAESAVALCDRIEKEMGSDDQTASVSLFLRSHLPSSSPTTRTHTEPTQTKPDNLNFSPKSQPIVSAIESEAKISAPSLLEDPDPNQPWSSTTTAESVPEMEPEVEPEVESEVEQSQDSLACPGADSILDAKYEPPSSSIDASAPSATLAPMPTAQTLNPARPRGALPNNPTQQQRPACIIRSVVKRAPTATATASTPVLQRPPVQQGLGRRYMSSAPDDLD